MSLPLAAVATIGLLLLAGAAAEREASTEDPSAATVETPLVWPERIRGQVLNESGEPVPGAAVTLELMTQTNRSFGGPLQTKRPLAQTTADADGRYEFDPADFPAVTSRPFGLNVAAAADGYTPWETWTYHSVVADPTAPQAIESELPTIHLPPGRIVRGVCVGADGRPAAGTAIWGYEGSRQYGWAEALFGADEHGRFEFVAPPGKSVGLWVVSPDWAPKFVVLPEEMSEPLRVELNTGTVIEGTLRNLAGQPVAGAVVVAESMDRGKLERYSLPVERAAKTDASGRFRLLPVGGPQQLYVTEAARATGETDAFVITADISVPPVPPQFLDIESGSTRTRTIQLREASLARISGTVRWADGTPAAEVVVRSGLTPPGNGAWLQFRDVYTDADGNYVIPVPASLDEVGLMLHQFVRKDAVNTAEPAGWGDRNAPRVGPMTADVPGRDFVFPARKP